MVDTVTLDAATAPSSPDTTSAGTPVVLTGGDGGSVNGGGGGVFLQGGAAPGSGGVGGIMQARAGSNPDGQNGTGGTAYLIAGNGDTPGDVEIDAGTSIHGGGGIYLFGGISTGDGDGGKVQINSGRGSNASNSQSTGGSIELKAANAPNGTNGWGGSIYITSGTKDGTGVAGHVVFNSGLENFADDAAAATGGVPVNGFYRTSSAVKIRVS